SIHARPARRWILREPASQRVDHAARDPARPRRWRERAFRDLEADLERRARALRTEIRMVAEQRLPQRDAERPLIARRGRRTERVLFGRHVQRRARERSARRLRALREAEVRD